MNRQAIVCRGSSRGDTKITTSEVGGLPVPVRLSSHLTARKCTELDEVRALLEDPAMLRVTGQKSTATLIHPASACSPEPSALRADARDARRDQLRPATACSTHVGERHTVGRRLPLLKSGGGSPARTV
jgi:hypothetical protein